MKRSTGTRGTDSKIKSVKRSTGMTRKSTSFFDGPRGPEQASGGPGRSQESILLLYKAQETGALEIWARASRATESEAQESGALEPSSISDPGV